MLSEQDIKDTDFGQAAISEGTPSPTSTPRSSLPHIGSFGSLAELAGPARFNLSASSSEYIVNAVPLPVPGEFAHYGLSYAGLDRRPHVRVEDDGVVGDTFDLSLEKDKPRPISQKKIAEFTSKLPPLPLLQQIARPAAVSTPLTNGTETPLSPQRVNLVTLSSRTSTGAQNTPTTPFLGSSSPTRKPFISAFREYLNTSGYPQANAQCNAAQKKFTK